MNTVIGSNSAGGAARSNRASKTGNNPDRSATPIPSRATNTRPRGGNPTPKPYSFSRCSSRTLNKPSVSTSAWNRIG